MTVYWEHSGMLHVPSYRARWEDKRAWYRENEILPHEEGGGKKGVLVETRDEPNGGIDSAKITNLITQVLG